jgi:hypothetical protein
MSAQTLTVQEVRDFFRENYGHVNIQGIPDSEIEGFLSTIQDLEKRVFLAPPSKERIMDLFYDRILSQGLTEIDE